MATQTIERNQFRTSPGRSVKQRATGVFGRYSHEQIADGLGWFSLGLGVAELFAPRLLSRVIGAREDHPSLMRLFGLREIAAGAVILSGMRAAGCWSRVGGDAVDLACLGKTLGTPGSDKGRAIFSIANVAAVTALDAATAWNLTQSGSGAFDVRCERAITVNKSPEECYRFWRDYQNNTPKYMPRIESVRESEGARQHWGAKGPAGMRIEFDAVLTSDEPGHCIGWRTLEGSDVDHSGSVHFDPAPGGRGTIVRVAMYYSPTTLASGGAAVAQLLGKVPEVGLYNDLRRFKQLLETGEVVRTEGQPAGRASGATWLDTVARY
jgi:uncharacterized membrane protein